MSEISLTVCAFQQPAGLFLSGVLPASEVITIMRADPRRYDAAKGETEGGVQRALREDRVREIANYARTVDAAFPSSVLLALDSGAYSLEENRLTIMGEGVADVVDGQHRIRGIERSDAAGAFQLPVVFMLDATEEQKALIFSIINGKQVKVPASIIYDLFKVTTGRSPQKTANEIASALNRDSDSPWYRRLKMLGKKTPGSDETLSQGTFVSRLIGMISRAPEVDRDRLIKGQALDEDQSLVFRGTFIRERDDVILKTLLNAFSAVRDNWPSEWDDPESLLTKTTGFGGFMSALPDLVRAGRVRKDLSYSFFHEAMRRTREVMEEEELDFTSGSFKYGSSGEHAVADLMRQGLRRLSATD